MLKVVALIGRPNVGKSVIFNRLVGKRKAVVEDLPGVTRDRLYGEVEWSGRKFLLVDTGGLGSEDTDMSTAVRRQVEASLTEADLILFVVDARAGVTSEDQQIADYLRRSGKVIILVANKAEGAAELLSEGYRLGMGEPMPVSAERGTGTGDLLDEVLERLPDEAELEEEPDRIRVALLGRPNVGKSSLVNAILGQERVIVAPEPGTTRDAVDISLEEGGRAFLLVDTAGVRRPSRIDEKVERFSVARTFYAIDRAQVALLVLDAAEGVTEQDLRLAGYVERAKRACLLVANKWDLVDGDEGLETSRIIRERFYFLPFFQMLTVSAVTGLRVARVLEGAASVYDLCHRRLPEEDLQRSIDTACRRRPPTASGRRRLRVLSVRQLEGDKLKIILQVNDPTLAPPQYRRYLENRLREDFKLKGLPVDLVFRR